MANSFPTSLFAVMQLYPENKAPSCVSESKWSRMQMSKKMVKSTFTLTILLGAVISGRATRTGLLHDSNMSSLPWGRGAPHRVPPPTPFL